MYSLQLWYSLPDLAMDDINTASYALTSLQTVEDEAESVMAPARKDSKGKCAGKQAKGKGGGKYGKGRGKLEWATRSGKDRVDKELQCLKTILR